VCKFDPESIQFTIVSDSMNGSQVWSQVSAESVFEDYAIASNHENTIALEMTIDHLLRTFKSIKSGSEVSMRLIKKNDQPFLSFTVKTQVSLLSSPPPQVSFLLLTLSLDGGREVFLPFAGGAGAGAVKRRD